MRLFGRVLLAKQFSREYGEYGSSHEPKETPDTEDSSFFQKQVMLLRLRLPRISISSN